MADRHIHEECGVFGIYSPKRAPLAELTYFGLYALQHRGQESAGIVVNDDGVFAAQKEPGLVGEAFTHDDLRALGETEREFVPNMDEATRRHLLRQWHRAVEKSSGWEEA